MLSGCKATSWVKRVVRVEHSLPAKCGEGRGMRAGITAHWLAAQNRRWWC